MHRFMVAQKIEDVGQELALPPEESVHAARVLRLKAGENVQLLDGGALYQAELTRVEGNQVEARVTALCPWPEPPAQAVLWQGLPKADKLEWIIQKATELGVWELWPVEMSRSIAKAEKGGKDDKKRERLSRIALEAAKQSGRAHVPEVRPALSLSQALEAAERGGFDLLLVAWEEEQALPMSRAVREYCRQKGVPGRVLLVIGPEGGISPDEKARLSALGAISVTLGRRILRTETAGLCALSVLWAALEEM